MVPLVLEGRESEENSHFLSPGLSLESPVNESGGADSDDREYVEDERAGLASDGVGA